MQSGAPSRVILWGGVGFVLMALAVAALSGEPPIGTSAACALAMFDTAPAALAWILGAWGLGLGAMRALGVARDRSLAMALGVGLMLWLSHVMGVLGAFHASSAGLALAWAPIVAGIAVLIADLRRTPSTVTLTRREAGLMLLPALGAALVMVAACVPPGTLWRSEAGQFDTLSYHLQLPREWLAAGRLWPMEHNAYSWLPSYAEAAYLHLAAMTSRPGRDPVSEGLPGSAILGAQMLHALITIACAWVAARAARRVRAHAGAFAEAAPDGCSTKARISASRVTQLASASIVLLTPWVMVVGSCAYNEMAVCLLLAGAALAVASGEIPAWKRGVLAGLIIGAACGAKPTAFFMAGAPIGLLMLARSPVRAWPGMLGAGILAGLIMLAPWLVRNELACGNPVFPWATGIFGDGPWTPLELSRWAAGHHSDAPLAARATLLMSERGFGHAQWWAVPLVFVMMAAMALVARVTRRAAWPIVAALVMQVLLWATIGHQQSRFLVPTVVTGALLTALAVAAVAGERSGGERGGGGAPRGAVIGVVLLQLSLALGCVRVWMNENASRPAAAMVGGVEAITGELLARAWRDLPEPDRAQILRQIPVESLVNLALGSRSPLRVRSGSSVGDAPARLYMLGNSTPLYFHVDVRWHTTWSISPIGAGVRAGSDLRTIVSQLARPRDQGGEGITHVLVNFDELARLHRDGWYDPEVTPELAARLIREHGEVIRKWPGPGGGSVLARLVP